MKLSEPYYNLVKTNKKTVEIRVYDEKRTQLSVGDKILFTKTDGSGEFRRTIKKLSVSKNFETALKRSTLRKAMPNLCKIMQKKWCIINLFLNRYKKIIKLSDNFIII